MTEDLEESFDKAMRGIYFSAGKEAHYNAKIFWRMINKHGGLKTAQILINSQQVSDGYTALWERGRLDLTVEALIWDNPQYQKLFTKDELRIVQKRLVDYEYAPALNSDNVPNTKI